MYVQFVFLNSAPFHIPLCKELTLPIALKHPRMLRWNAVLVLLTVLLFLDAILIISRDLTFHVNNNDSILPTHKETHDRRKSRVDQLKDSTSIGTSPLHVSDNEVDEDEQNGEVENNKEATNDEEAEAQGDDSSQHKVAGLNCEAYGGPSQEEAAEMVYWQDIPSDSNYVSPLKATGPEIKYLTFEPDEGATRLYECFAACFTCVNNDLVVLFLGSQVVGTIFACPWKQL